METDPLRRPHRLHSHRHRCSAKTMRTKPVLCTDPVASFDYFTMNLALGGKAVQSSTYIYPTLAAAQNAVDGNRQSISMLGSCNVTNGDMNPWWRVDLLDVYRVTRVSITNRGDCCEKRIEGIQIRIGNSLENNGNNNELAATVGPIPLGNTKTFEFKPIKGRYVNLFLPGRNEFLTL
ncbi:fucolectin-like [Sinocyclocheilus anshuiensis]|uniref:fucolectin-like n=1 Tax=Sinocyclocheilus anshuiensis TaxID=1608454 RepID=UPI0007B7C44B|nr:PREDICTED: fucolectin-like [Sinocyclocheilus anshuiensis]